MDKFNAFYKNILINESSLSRIWQFAEYNDKNFGILSAHRSVLPHEENVTRQQELMKKIRDMGYGFIELGGGWKDSDPNSPTLGVTNDEESILVPNITKKEALDLGQHYEQNSIIYKDNDNFALLCTDPKIGVGTVFNQFKMGQGRENLTFIKELTDEYFSSLKKGSHRGVRYRYQDKKA